MSENLQLSINVTAAVIAVIAVLAIVGLLINRLAVKRERAGD